MAKETPENELTYMILADDGYDTTYWVANQTLATDPDTTGEPAYIEYTEIGRDALVMKPDKKEYMQKIVDRINNNEDGLNLDATLVPLDELVE